MPGCIFCQIASGKLHAVTVYEDEQFVAFLDHRPLFPGHVLVIPRGHYETLVDVPGEVLGPYFQRVQLLAAAVQQAMEAEGTFVAENNSVSQSVPHMHVHVVPRRKGDGLKGFFWPRKKYASEEDMQAVAQRISAQLKT
jgi:histidine triad (HIT) family protein